MSIQETYLQGIGDAIRGKDGTTAPIPANTFAARIAAIPSGASVGMPDLKVAIDSVISIDPITLDEISILIEPKLTPSITVTVN